MNRRILASTLLLAVAALPAPAQVLQSGRGGVALTGVEADGTARVETAAGEVELFPLPEGVSLAGIEEVAGGWVAAGGLRSGPEYELYLLRAAAGVLVPIAAPEKTSPYPRGQPVVLSDGKELVGLAWLEGPGPLGVYAAVRNGEEWGPVERVSPPGEHEQLALAGAVLDDGSWLLLWAAVDGNDDEILWSRRTAEGWGAPARVHEDNQVPDIKPVVAALPGGGALAAWSWYDDGHYRLRTARFDGESWLPGATFRGRGSLSPSLHRMESSVLLLYLTMAPESWSVVEFDAAGLPARTARLLDPPHRRPLLGESAPSEVVLRWPGLGAPEEASPELRLVWEPVP